MSRFPAPAADPHALRDAARRLTRVGDELQGRGGQLDRTAAGTRGSWQGSASLLMVARAQRLADATRLQEDALHAVARATDRYAEQVEQAQSEVRRLNQLWDEAQHRAQQQVLAAERAAREAAAQAQSGVRQRYDDGSGQLADTRAELERRFLLLNADLEQDGWSLQRALAERDPVAFLPEWVAGGLATGKAVVKGYGVASKAVPLGQYSLLVWQVSRFYRLSREPVRVAIGASAEHHALTEALHGKRHAVPVLGRPLTAVGRVFLPMTVLTGGIDVATGGGYEGWRDPVTRVAGAAGVAGGGALLLAGAGIIAPLGPVGLAVAGAAVLGYAAWGLGNLVYDNRAAIGAFCKAYGAGVRRVVPAATRVGRSITDAVGSARDLLAVGARGAREAASDAVDTGRKVVGVLTPPRWLVPRVAGLFR